MFACFGSANSSAGDKCHPFTFERFGAKPSICQCLTECVCSQQSGSAVLFFRTDGKGLLEFRVGQFDLPYRQFSVTRGKVTQLFYAGFFRQQGIKYLFLIVTYGADNPASCYGDIGHGGFCV